MRKVENYNYPGWHVLLSVTRGSVEDCLGHGESVRLFVGISVPAGNTSDHFSHSLTVSSLSYLSFLSSGSYLELVSKLTLAMALFGCQEFRAFFVPAGQHWPALA